MATQEPKPKPSTWLITGASTGFGRSISLAALASGQRVIGATRDVDRARATNPDFAAKGGVWIQLDPARPESSDLFAKAQEEYDVDVLVNNAGYAFIGGVEDTSEAEVQDQFDVNFWGPLRAVRAVLPYMRAKGRGEIVLVSSGSVYMNHPGRSAYTASKLAIEAIHESLHREVSTLGIKVLIVQPGGFRTPWPAHLKTPAAQTTGFSAAYKGTPVEAWVGGVEAVKTGPLPDAIKGDVDKGARAIVDAVLGGHDGYLRLPLGPDCVRAAEKRLVDLRRDVDATREVAMSTDGEGPVVSG